MEYCRLLKHCGSGIEKGPGLSGLVPNQYSVVTGYLLTRGVCDEIINKTHNIYYGIKIGCGLDTFLMSDDNPL